MSKNLIHLRKGKLAENTGFEPYAFLIFTGRSAIELIFLLNVTSSSPAQI